jgi:hypothetical protein
MRLTPIQIQGGNSMEYVTVFAAVAGCSFLVGCTMPRQVAEPSQITLDRAILEVADSLANVQKATADRKKAGLIVDEAKVEFNVVAKATNTANGSTSISAVPLSIGGTAGLTVSNQLVNEGTRSNTVTVTFKNIATADYSKGGKEIVERCGKTPNADGCPVVVMSQPPKLEFE